MPRQFTTSFLEIKKALGWTNCSGPFSLTTLSNEDWVKKLKYACLAILRFRPCVAVTLNAVIVFFQLYCFALYYINVICFSVSASRCFTFNTTRRCGLLHGPSSSPFGQKKSVFYIYFSPNLGHYWWSVVISLNFNSNLSNFFFIFF